MSIEVAQSLIPGSANTTLDARSRVTTLAEIPDIKLPALGAIFFCVETGKHYKITKLKSKLIGPLQTAEAAVDEYEELPDKNDLPGAGQLLPAGGTKDQVLARDADGAAVWVDPATTEDGQLLPGGGTTGQVLTRVTEGGAAWSDPPQVDDDRLVPPGGTTGQVLTPAGWATLEVDNTLEEAYLEVRIPQRSDGHALFIRVTLNRDGFEPIIWFSATDSARFWTGLEWIDSPSSFGGGQYGGMLVIAAHTLDGYAPGAWGYRAESLIYDAESSSYVMANDDESGILLAEARVEFPAIPAEIPEAVKDLGELTDAGDVIGTRAAEVVNAALYPSWKTLTYAASLAIKSADGPLQTLSLTGDVTLTAPSLSRSIPALILEIETQNLYSVKIGTLELVAAGAATRVQIMWYWRNSGSVGRYPVVVLS